MISVPSDDGQQKKGYCKMKEITYGELLLPAEIAVAAERQCQLWWSTIAAVEEGDRSVYFETQCPIGKCTSRGFLLEPTREQLGDYPLTVRCRDLRTRTILGEQTVKIHVVDPDAGSGARTILMLGDSRTWHSVGGEPGKSILEAGNKTTTAELKALLERYPGADFTFLGTRVSELDKSVRNLADNGWQYGTAISVLEDAGGVRSYIENDCKAGVGASLDYATAMFGINDLADWHQNNLDQYERSTAKIDRIVADAKKLFSMILSDYPDCRILLILEPSTAGNQDGFGFWGASDADCQPEWEFAVKALRKRMLAEFDCGRYHKNVTVSAAGLWCDRIYGYPYLMVPQSERTPDALVLQLRNCVHPSDCGYRQIADGYFSSVKYLESLRKC